MAAVDRRIKKRDHRHRSFVTSDEEDGSLLKFRKGSSNHEAECPDSVRDKCEGPTNKLGFKCISNIASLITIPVSMTQFIGPEGGLVEILGFKIDFPEGALAEKEKITVSVDNNPENYPTEIASTSVTSIAPILGFKPSMQFNKPVNITMPTWFRPAQNDSVNAILYYKKSGSQWKILREIPMGMSYQVEFTVKNFSEFGLSIKKEDIDEGTYKISNDVFIQSGTGMIQSTFYVDDQKTCRNIRNDMLCMNFSKMCSRTMHLSGRRQDEITLEVEVDLERPTESNRGPDVEEKIRSHDHFRIEKVVEWSKHEIQIITSLRPTLKDYQGCINGIYILSCNGEKDTGVLQKEWPFTPDQADIRVFYNSEASAGQPNTYNITAGTFATGQAKVQQSQQNPINQIQSQGK